MIETVGGWLVGWALFIYCTLIPTFQGRLPHHRQDSDVAALLTDLDYCIGSRLLLLLHFLPLDLPVTGQTKAGQANLTWIPITSSVFAMNRLVFRSRQTFGCFMFLECGFCFDSVLVDLDSGFFCVVHCYYSLFLFSNILLTHLPNS